MNDKLKNRHEAAVKELEKFMEQNCAYALIETGKYLKNKLKPEHLRVITRLRKRIKHFSGRVGEHELNSKYYSDDTYLARRTANQEKFLKTKPQPIEATPHVEEIAQ